jgi:hypothetical protein
MEFLSFLAIRINNIHPKKEERTKINSIMVISLCYLFGPHFFHPKLSPYFFSVLLELYFKSKRQHDREKKSSIERE